jgi:hypothetical protein
MKRVLKAAYYAAVTTIGLWLLAGLAVFVGWSYWANKHEIGH